MPSIDRKWISPALIAVAVLASVAAYGRVPALIDLRFEALLPFAMTRPPGPAPRSVALFLIPALALVIWAAFRLAATAAGQRLARHLFPHAPAEVTSPGQFERFGKTYDTIVLGVVVLLLGLHAAVLAAALDAPSIATRLVPAALGGSLVLMGNVMPRLRPNWVAGLRTRRLLEDPQLWRTTHRVFGAAFVVSGLLTILVAGVAPRYGLLVGVVSLLVSLVIGAVASTRQSGTVTHAALVAVGLLCGAASGISAQMPQGAASPIELSAPAGVAEAPFTFVRGGLTLHGTLVMPRFAPGKVPVIVIVAGSGPTDRNGNGPLTNTNTYALMAWALAEHGIASVRYDKRGIGKSAGSGGDPTTLSMDHFVADVAAAAAAIASDARFSRVILLGHSEGAGHVVQAANRGSPAAGVIMVSAQGRRLADLLHEQFSRQADSATVARIDSAFARFVRGDDPGEVPPIARSVIIPAYRTFMTSFAAYDPPGEARRFAGPLLILQGTTDVQVTMQDAELLHAAQPRATFLRLDGVNHVLKSIESMELQAQVKTYGDPSMPLAASVVPSIARWIGELPK
jgi:uncharacterized protein